MHFTMFAPDILFFSAQNIQRDEVIPQSEAARCPGPGEACDSILFCATLNLTLIILRSDILYSYGLFNDVLLRRVPLWRVPGLPVWKVAPRH